MLRVTVIQIYPSFTLLVFCCYLPPHLSKAQNKLTPLPNLLVNTSIRKLMLLLLRTKRTDQKVSGAYISGHNTVYWHGKNKFGVFFCLHLLNLHQRGNERKSGSGRKKFFCKIIFVVFTHLTFQANRANHISFTFLPLSD